VTAAENRETIIRYWLEKAGESLDAARDEHAAGRFTFAVNRAYYACFYAVSALLLSKEMRFKKHSGVRAAFQQHFVKTAKVSREDGRLFDELFESRQRADYMELIKFEAAQVKEYARHSVLDSLLDRQMPNTDTCADECSHTSFAQMFF